MAQRAVYLKSEMAGVAYVEQVAVGADEADFLGHRYCLLVQLVYDVAIDGGELEREGLGEFGVFADKFGECAQAVEHEMRVELQF